MAQEAGELLVKISADIEELKSAMTKSKNAVTSFSSSAGEAIKSFGQLVTGIGGVVVAFGAKAVQAYGEQEVAIANLNQALANQGKFTEATSKSLQDYASELQNVSTFGDEAIISVQAQLVAFGLEGEQLKKTTKATLDLAAAKGVDLAAAAQLLGKAFVGETGTLARYGIVLDENIPKTEKFAAAMDKVNTMFGGQAQAKAKTFTGQIEGLQLAFSDLQEEVGAFIAGEGESYLAWLTKSTKEVSGSMATIRAFASEFKSLGAFLEANFILVITALGQAFLSVGSAFISVSKVVVKAIFTIADSLLEVNSRVYEWAGNIPIIGVAFRAVADGIDVVKEKMNLLRDSALTGMDQSKLAIDNTNLSIGEQAVKLQNNLNTNEYVTSRMLSAEQLKQAALNKTKNLEDTNRNSKLAKDAAAMAQSTKAKEATAMIDMRIEDAIAEHQKKSKEEVYEHHWKIMDAMMLTTKAWTDFATKATSQLFDSFGQGMAEVLVDGKSFSQAMATIWKDLARMIVAEIVKMIAKWLAFLALRGVVTAFGGPAAGAALQGILSGVGRAATGAMINEPSLVTGLKSGKSILAGEAGPEAIVPSGGNKTASEMGMDFSGGSGGITINITGQFLEGDETQWQRMFRQKILPEIRRSTMSNPTGNFIRKRGATQ